MTVPDSLVGRTYPTQAYDVSRAKVVEFLTAVGGQADTSTDEPLLAPATFAMIPVLHGLDQLVNDLGIDFARVIHADQRFSYERPIRSGDVLQVTTSIASVRAVAGNSLIGLRCEIADAEGERVTVATSSLLIRTPEHAMGG